MADDSPLSDTQAQNVRDMLAWASKNVWGNQTSTGERLGIGQVYVSQLITGVRSITADIAMRLAFELKVPIDSLLSGEALEDAKLGFVAKSKAEKNTPREKAIKCLAILKDITLDESRAIFDYLGLSMGRNGSAEEWLAEGLAQYSRNLLGPKSTRFSS